MAHIYRWHAGDAQKAAVERLCVPRLSLSLLCDPLNISPTDRLENEHLGNMDQYRVTREVPLPYTFDDRSHETDMDEDDRQSISSWRSRRMGQRSKTPQSDAQTRVQDMDAPADI